MKQLDTYWYSRSFIVLLLLPLSWLFRLITLFRRWLYQLGLLKTHRIPVPVIVVGNINVGGTGKSPLVIWLAQFLKEAGYLPGIISRGYGGKSDVWPQQVLEDSDVEAVGEEAVMISQRSQCPMAVGPDRVAAARSLLKYTDCDVIISDDGLQHYSLGRDLEIVVIDGIRRFGNGHFLPAGPLRESRTRLNKVDLIVVNGTAGPKEYQMKLISGKVQNCKDSSISCDLSDFNQQEVHGVAAIGHPKRFFNDLIKSGLKVVEHPFRDHYFFKLEDISYNDTKAVLMTEKDAVKCKSFAQAHHWFVPVDAKLDDRFGQRLLALLVKAVDRKINRKIERKAKRG